MKRVSVLVCSLVVALCMALALAGCSTNSYTPESKSQTVNNSALKTSGTLRVGVNASNAPYAAESNGNIVGIDVDVAAALADQMGLKLELVDVGSSADTAFSKENVDIVMGVTKSNSAYWMSDPYMTSAIALFSLTKNATAPSASGSFTIAAQSSSMSAWEVTDHYGESCLKSSTDIQSAFESLSTGSVNYVAVDSTIGEYVIHTSTITAYPIALLQEASSYSIAVSSSNTALQTAVSEALSQLKSGGIISVVQSKWLGSQPDISSLKVVTATAQKESSTEEVTIVDSGASSTSSTSSSSSSTSTGSSNSSSSSSKTTSN